MRNAALKKKRGKQVYETRSTHFKKKKEKEKKERIESIASTNPKIHGRTPQQEQQEEQD